MSVATVMGVLLAAVTVGLFFTMFGIALKAKARVRGVPVRVDCPEDHAPAEVRIGKTDEGELAVLSCDRFPNRPIGCRQACFITLPAGNGTAKSATGA